MSPGALDDPFAEDMERHDPWLLDTDHVDHCEETRKDFSFDQVNVICGSQLVLAKNVNFVSGSQHCTLY